jgi:hypothetical protein
MVRELVINTPTCSLTGSPVGNCECSHHKKKRIANRKPTTGNSNDDEDDLDDEDEDDDIEENRGVRNRRRGRFITINGKRVRCQGRPLVLNESSVEFNYTGGPALINNGEVVAGGRSSLYSVGRSGDDYSCPDDSHIDTSDGEDDNRDTMDSMGKASRVLTAASMTIANSDRAVDHSIRAANQAEKGDYAGAAVSHMKAAATHEKLGQAAAKANDESAGDHFRVSSAHRQMSRTLRKLAESSKQNGPTSNRRPTIPSAGGDPLPHHKSVTFNYDVDSPPHLFDRVQPIETGALRAGGSRFIDERETAPPPKRIRRGEEGEEASEPPLDGDQLGIPHLTEPFDGRGVEAVRRKKGSRRSVTDPAGHPTSGTDDDYEHEANQPRGREDVDSDNYKRLGLAMNRSYQQQIRDGIKPTLNITEVIALERLAQCPKLAQ